MSAHPMNKGSGMPWEDAPAPRRKSGPSVVGELDSDVMDCGDPEATWKEMVRHLRWRASNSRSLAFDCEQTAKDSAESATIFAAQADDFDALANALERASVTFPASADTRPKGGDATEIAAPFTSGAVPKADAQRRGPSSDKERE